MSDDSDGADARRKRIRQACLNCRRKKVRCGGEKPVCDFCSRLSQMCVYTEDGRSQRRGSLSFHVGEDETSNLTMGAPASRFMAMEDRLSRIESTLERFETLLSSFAQTPSVPPPSAPPITQPETSYPAADTMLNAPPAPAPLSGFGLPVHTVLFAADVYFRFCHNQPYSLFHEATLRHRIATGDLPEHQLWALLAAARRYSTLPDLQLNAADDAMFYVKRAWGCLKLPWSGMSGDEEVVQVIQTIILLVSIEHPAGHCASAYMKLGFAIRMALHSKLHVEPDASVPPVLREERRRTFWSLYLQDKLISLAKERFPSLPDDECCISLPCSEAAFRDGRDEHTPTLHAFTGDCLDSAAADACYPLALISVMASTLGRVSQYVLQENRYSQLGLPWSSASPHAAIASTLLQLELHFGMGESTRESLEKRCFINGAVDQHLAGSFIYSKALFHLAHCLLHHPFLLQQRLQRLRKKAPPSFVQAAWQTCRKHAMSLTDLKDMRHHNVIILTSLYGYCTMVAGTIHVLSMNDEDPAVRDAGAKHYKTAIEFLQELSCYWKHAALMVNRLERFRQQQGEGRRPPLDTACKQDVQALWQSVDYALMSTPTRPGTPTPGDTVSGLPDFFLSPNSLFDFADIGTLGEMADACRTPPLLQADAL